MMAYHLDVIDEDSISEEHMCQMCNVSSFPEISETSNMKSEKPKMQKFKKPKKKNIKQLESNWFGIDTNEVEMNSLPTNPEGEWEVIEASVDSGSTDSVAPKDLFGQFKLRPSEGSLAGRSYVSATKHERPNLGERTAEFMTGENVKQKIVLQEADIHKVLISVAKLVENDDDVQLSKRNPHIRNLKTGKITKLHRKRGQFLVRLHVKIKNEPVFTRQGS